MSRKIDGVDSEKKQILKKTQFPIANMAFGENDIMYNDIPFESASAAEQIKMAVAIYEKLQPELRLINIPQGSMLDSKSIMELEVFAVEKGFQIILETVQKGHAQNQLILTEGRIEGGEWRK